MNNINKINFFQKNNIQSLQPMQGAISINSIDAQDTTVKSFKDVVSNMMNELNEVTNKPQQLTNDMLQGNADIHEVMTAVAESELIVQAVTTITGKILQTYEKIMQIQI